jgi:D-amino-acid oxidase
MNGYGLEDETPDRGEAEATIGVVAPLFPSIRPPASG